MSQKEPQERETFEALSWGIIIGPYTLRHAAQTWKMC